MPFPLKQFANPLAFKIKNFDLAGVRPLFLVLFDRAIHRFTRRRVVSLRDLIVNLA